MTASSSTASLSRRRRNTLGEAFITQIRVIYAIMMHDMKARFFGTGLGYIVTILWPCAHIIIIVGIFYFTKHRAPYGSSPLLYACIGVLPYIFWNYISRFTILSVMQNRSFLQYPMVSLIDLMIGRQSLELVSSTIITIGIVVFLLACDIDPMPHRPVAAAGAIFSAVLLGMGFGLVAGVITMIWPLFNIVYTGVVIVAWVSSGLVINPEAMPSDIGENLAWNPLLHSVEWMRYAYYDDFPARLLDKTYVISVGAGSLALGLLAERLLRVVFRRG